MYLVWLPPGTPRSEVAPVMLDRVAPALLDLGPRGLVMDLDDDRADVPPPVPPPPGEPTPQAVVSVWLDAYDRRGPVEEVLAASTQRFAGYHVLESLYCDYGGNRWSGPRDWPDGQRSPGLLTVALFTQRPDMALEEWLDVWHTRQSPVSEAIQPRCRYVRNTVFRPLTPGAAPYRGIVEEAWPSAGHVTDPMLFYCANGDRSRMEANMTTMVETVTAFIDLRTLRSLTMSEWILRS